MAEAGRISLAGTAWWLAASLVAPLLPWHLRRRIRRGKELPGRLAERYGLGAELPPGRPPGRLLWLHAASVGEALSTLPLLEALAERDPALRLLVTTGTVTGAEALRRRLPPALLAPDAAGHARITHRFAPLDVPGWVGRFLDGWRPDAGALVESELWPNLLAAARARRLPMALVNARMSARSFARWRRLPGLAGTILGGFRLVLARSAADRARLAALGAVAAESWGDLKWAAPPLPADAAELARLKALLAGRPVFLAASTHPGEDAVVLAAHDILARAHPGLLTVLVPRHPERGPAVAALARGLGHAVARRGAGEAPSRDHAVHVADTLGELGLFYRLADVALVGGSLVPRGGQNPLEPARLGCPILLGPHTFNFEEAVGRLLEAGGARRVSADPVALAEQVAAVLSNCGGTQAMVAAAAGLAEGQAGLPGQVADALLALLPGPGAAPG
ncbi:3-deoxy-D-manno-octulosonic acid transferase [Falsiroseomonas selenitidurans]|uniref:3-deoxy-D-manno-octulosonic acid transferase n=1 Tax=Falsiroseomonas selenitidurans TaxID=2716335 RepID=UPI002E2E6235|nr:3-deoxy-D-manno-octulosonic acid transferase [Falsiroseomonas selenitidurans]